MRLIRIVVDVSGNETRHVSQVVLVVLWCCVCRGFYLSFSLNNLVDRFSPGDVTSFLNCPPRHDDTS